MTKLVHGYQHVPDAVCPNCGDSYGMMETTDDPKVFKYTCWCGSTCKATED